MEGVSLLGRESHLGVLDEALDDAVRGRARTVTVHGEIGSGKTALLDAAATRVPVGMRVLRISGHPAEQDLPLAGVHQLIRLGGLDTIGDPGADPLRDAAALLDGLTGLARRAPLLLLVDDAQWLDRQSRRALTFTARRLDGDALCMVFGVRSSDDDLMVGTRLDVEPLSTDESVDLLRRDHPMMSARVAAKIAAHAQGLPLALSEVPLDLSDAQISGNDPLPDDLPVGRSLARWFAPGIAALPDATRLCLLAASFDTLDASTYRAVLRELGCGPADLDAAERSGLVRVRDGRCEFLHPLGAAAVRAEARWRELVAVHRALATQCADDPIRLAFHLRRDPDAAGEILLAVLEEGAAHADAARSHDQAAELWQAAADLSDDPVAGRRRLREAIRCLVMAGAGAEAQVLIRELLAQTTEATERAHALEDLTWVSLWTRSVAPDDDEQVESHAVALLDSPTPEARVLGRDLLVAAATAMLANGKYRRAQQVCRTLIAHAGVTLTVEQRLLCDVIAVVTGEPAAGDLLRRADAWVEAYPWHHILDPATPAGFITVVLGWLGEYDTLDAVMAHCRRAADVHGPSVSGLYIVNSMTATRERYRGRWDRALREFERLEQIVVDTDFAAPYPFVALRHAHLLAAMGDMEACESRRRRARERAPRWVPILAHLDHAVAGLLALAHRAFSVSLEHLDAAGRIEREVGLVPSGYLSRFADAFEAAWRLGEADARLNELTRFEDAMRAVQHRGMLGLAARCRALVAPPDEMDTRFADAVDLLGGEPDGFEVARTHLLWGERLRRARRKADAHRKLSLAQATFTRLGARAWADQCASELAACGIRRVAEPAAGAVSHLTPREFDVVREVASGASNADAARRLFISERTVEFHLYNAFRKLDIDSRDALSGIIDPR